MIRNTFALFSAVLVSGTLAYGSFAQGAPASAPAAAPATVAKIGAPAPDFTLTDTTGKSHSLSSFKGKTVVLEWFNKDCPYVQKHYNSSNMQALQKKYTDQGVVWLTIISSAQGKQGFETAANGNQTRLNLKMASTATLLDSNGNVGDKLYKAKTTPHMYVIDPKGTLVYNGAIDSISSSDPADIPKAENYVASAIDLVAAGKPVKTATTKPYGCSVKY